MKKTNTSIDDKIGRCIFYAQNQINGVKNECVLTHHNINFILKVAAFLLAEILFQQLVALFYYTDGTY